MSALLVGTPDAPPINKTSLPNATASELDTLGK